MLYTFMEHSNGAYIQDILDNIAIPEKFLQGIGKEDFKNENSEVDWRGLKSMRNLLIHEYAHVDADEVWKACQVDVPELKQNILGIVIPN